MDFEVICEIEDDEPMWFLYEISERRKKRLVECFKTKDELKLYINANNIQYIKGKTIRKN